MESLKYINKYFLKYKWRLLLGIGFVASSNYLAIHSIVNARYAIDFMSSQASIVGNEAVMKQVAIYGATIIVLAALSGLFLFFTRQTIIVMSRLIEYDIKNEIYEHYQRLDMSFYKRNNTGDLMNRISEDVGKVRMYIGPAIMYVFNTGFRIAFTIFIMINVNATLTFYVLLPLPVLAITIYFISSVINKKSTLIQEQLSLITTFVQETFSGIRVLKSYAREEDSLDKFTGHNENYKKYNIGLVKVEAMFHPTIILLVGVSNLIIIYIGGMLAIDGKVSYGNIVEFMLYVNALTWPIASLGWVTSLIQRAAASQKRINEFLETSTSIDALIETSSGNEVASIGDITFKNVNFTYPDTGIEAIRDLSFTIKQGSTVAIIGKTGSGKSTVLNLICRLFDVDKGEVCIGGENVKNINLASFRANTGVVPQDVFLFSDTIANNIGFALDRDLTKNEASKRIEEAAQKAVVYDNIISFPEKFQTKVGERGITLSGGQKQRISITRAIIKQPKLLIFDDCLSAVDIETEERILHNLSEDLLQTTSIIVSHRISAIKRVDNIIVLDEGCIVEQGTHSDLLENKAYYYDMYQQQLMEKSDLN